MWLPTSSRPASSGTRRSARPARCATWPAATASPRSSAFSRRAATWPQVRPGMCADQGEVARIKLANYPPQLLDRRMWLCLRALAAQFVDRAHGVAELTEPVLGVLADEPHAPRQRL